MKFNTITAFLALLVTETYMTLSRNSLPGQVYLLGWMVWQVGAGAVEMTVKAALLLPVSWPAPLPAWTGGKSRELSNKGFTAQAVLMLSVV